MLYIRKSKDRGKSQIDWLDSNHTFSFADYYDSRYMGYSVLRVINEDTVKPSGGFAMHPHKDMEIITYVIEGELEHKDSMGTGSIIHPGEIQRMSAGTGITHSEFNHSKENPVHLLQIWITPAKTGLKPSYEQKTIPQMKNQFILIGSSEGSDKNVTIHQDIKIYAAYLTNAKPLEYTLAKNRLAWIQLVKGKVEINQQLLEHGDGGAFSAEATIQIKSTSNEAEFLLFDLPE